jgi:steroid delta-isomerase-like uncharacterized protein
MQSSAEVLVRRWFQDLWTDGKVETIDQLMAANAVIHGLPTPDGGPMHGTAGFRPLFEQFKGAFPDMAVAIDQVVSQDDLVAVHCHVTGTHSGPGLGAPTHKRVHFTGITIARAKDGQLVEGWNAFDFLGCYQQIGIVTMNQ